MTHLAPKTLKHTPTPAPSATDPDRKFWEEVNSGLFMIIRAIARRWLGRAFSCKHCKQPL
jgi:hypothetical protein